MLPIPEVLPTPEPCRSRFFVWEPRTSKRLEIANLVHGTRHRILLYPLHLVRVVVCGARGKSLHIVFKSEDGTQWLAYPSPERWLTRWEPAVDPRCVSEVWWRDRALAAEQLVVEMRAMEHGERCTQCGHAWNPSLVESGWCIFCIQKDTRKKLDAANERIADLTRY